MERKNILSGTMQLNKADRNTQLLNELLYCFIIVFYSFKTVIIYIGDNPFCVVTDLHREGLTNTAHFLPSLGNFKFKIAQKYITRNNTYNIGKHKTKYLFCFLVHFWLFWLF